VQDPPASGGCTRPIAFTIDFEDWYHGVPISGPRKAGAERRLDRSGNRLLDLLDEHGVRGTFFILGPVVEENPSLVRRIADRGHEIGCHGWSHDLLYTMSKDRFRDETRRSLDAIADVTGRRASAYRAAYFSITRQSLWALEVLADLGVRYDSSIFPVHNWRYGIPDFGEEPRWIETAAGPIAEFPLSVNRALGQNVPACGGAYFRLYPYSLTRYGLRSRLKRGRPTVFYIHPWELDEDHPNIRFHWRARLTHYANLRGTEKKLRRLFSDFEFAPLGQVIEECLRPS
jgi:polysaccharide deacetylase family protein (PEP-CTERM system associated)